jgi:hypothetical protein
MKGLHILMRNILRKDKIKYLDYIFYFGFFCILLLWSMMLRFNDAPDELGRYSICQYIFNHGTLPHGGNPEIRLKDWGFSYAFQPILPYILGGYLMKFTALFTNNAYFYIIAARLVSVLCGTIMAVFVHALSKKIFKSYELQWIFTLLIMLLPQNMFMFVYVNTDSMAIMSSAIIVYAWYIGLESKWDYKSSILLAVGMIFCALSYYNAYGYILCSFILFTTYHFTYDKTNRRLLIDWNNFLRKGALIAVIVILGAGWWFLRNYLLYDGDILGLHTRTLYGEKYAALEHLKPSQAKTYYNAGFSLFRMLKETDYISMVSSSFIGRFGYMDIPLNGWIYSCYGIILSSGAIGLLFKSKKPILPTSMNAKNQYVLHFCMILCILLPIYLCTMSSYARDYQPQGRYLLPMLVPFMYYISIGLNKLFDIIFTYPLSRRIVIIALNCFFLFIVLSFMKSIVFANYWGAFYHFMIDLF